MLLTHSWAKVMTEELMLYYESFRKEFKVIRVSGTEEAPKYLVWKDGIYTEEVQVCSQ